VKGSLRAFFNCGNGNKRLPKSGLVILKFLVINGVTDTGRFSFQRNYMLVNGISEEFSHEAPNYEA
jgi:hypothetical protein